MKHILSYFTIFFINITIFSPLAIFAAEKALSPRKPDPAQGILSPRGPKVDHLHASLVDNADDFMEHDHPSTVALASHRKSIAVAEQHLQTFPSTQLPANSDDDTSPKERSLDDHFADLQANMPTIQAAQRRKSVLNLPGILGKPQKNNRSMQDCDETDSTLADPLVPVQPPFGTVHGFNDSGSNKTPEDANHSSSASRLATPPNDLSIAVNPIPEQPNQLSPTHYALIGAGTALSIVTLCAAFRRSSTQSNANFDLFSPQKRFYVPGMETAASGVAGFAFSSLAGIVTTGAGLAGTGLILYKVHKSWSDWVHHKCKVQSAALKTKLETQETTYAAEVAAVKKELAAVSKTVDDNAKRTDANFAALEGSVHALGDDTEKKFRAVAKCAVGLRQHNAKLHEQLNALVKAINELGQHCHKADSQILTSVQHLAAAVQAAGTPNARGNLAQITREITAAQQALDTQVPAPLQVESTRSTPKSDDPLAAVTAPLSDAADPTKIGLIPLKQTDKVKPGGCCCTS